MNAKPIARKKDEMMNSLDDKVLGLTKKGTIFKENLYSHTWCKGKSKQRR